MLFLLPMIIKHGQFEQICPYILSMKSRQPCAKKTNRINVVLKSSVAAPYFVLSAERRVSPLKIGEKRGKTGDPEEDGRSMNEIIHHSLSLSLSSNISAIARSRQGCQYLGHRALAPGLPVLTIVPSIYMNIGRIHDLAPLYFLYFEACHAMLIYIINKHSIACFKVQEV